MTDLTRPAAIATLLIIISAGAATYLILDDPPVEDLWNGDLSLLETELRTRIISYMASNTDMEPEEMGTRIQSNIPLWISISRSIISGYSINVISREVSMERIDLDADIPTPTPGWEGTNPGLTPNSLMYGDSGSIPIVPTIRSVSNIMIRLDPITEGEVLERELSVTADIIDPVRTFNVLSEIIDEDSNGWGSGLARDVEYLLNVLARIRTVNGVGAQNSQTDLNVINPGDVELVLNIAVAFRMLKWTGNIPDDLTRNIDLYFSGQRSRITMNPTGYRPWSESEKENFERYEARSGYGSRKTITDQLNTGLDIGHMDIGDIFSSYLYFEKTVMGSSDGVTNNPADFSSPLDQYNMVNMRDNLHGKDPYALAVHYTLPDRESTDVSPAGSVLDQEILEFSPDIDIVEDYLVIGRDFLVDEMGSVRAWYTNANPERSPTDLISLANASSNTVSNSTQGRGTRCGGVPFPKALEERWFRMEWDLRIHGSFTMIGDLGTFGGSVMSEVDLEKNIVFDFPVRIYTWFSERPLNDNIIFFNLNEGEDFADANKSGWVVTPEANATEVFERDVASYFWDVQASLSSLMRTLQWDVPKIWSDTLSLWRQYQNMAMYTLSDLQRWISDPDNQDITDLHSFWEGNLSEGALIPLLDPIHIDGFTVDLDFSTVSDRLDITYSAPDGMTIISIHGLIKRPIYFTFRVITDSLRVDLDLIDNTFLISDISGETGLRIGSESPNQPPEQILDLVMDSDWIMKSGGATLNGNGVPNPFFSSAYGTSYDANFSLSFSISGSGDSGEILRIAESEGDPTTFLTDMDLLSSMSRIGGSIYGSGFEEWFGITLTRKGSGDVISMERTLWIKPDSRSSWDSFVSSSYPAGIISTLARSGYSDLDGSIFDGDLKGLDVVLTERSPVWSVSYKNHEASDFLVVTHINNGANPEYTGIYCYYIEENIGYPVDNSGWGVFDNLDTVPLW